MPSPRRGDAPTGAGGMTKSYRFLVSGRVQGVGFRWFVLRAADRLGATGWVKNRNDGRVEVLAQGDPKTLDRLHEMLEEGSAISRVENVEKSDVTSEVDTFKSFEII